MYLFFGTFFELALSTCISPSECFDENFFEILVILSALLLPIKSAVASAVFSINIFGLVFIASVGDVLAI